MAALDYYVNTDTGDDDTGNGSSGTPWASLAKACLLNLNLTTNHDTCTIHCAGTTADTTTATIAGWTTAAADYLEIVGDFGGPSWDATKYHMEITDGRGIDIQDQYVRVRNLQIKVTGLTGDTYCIAVGTIVSGGSAFIFDSLYLCGDPDEAANGLRGIGLVDTTDIDVATVYNCIITDMAKVSDTSSRGITSYAVTLNVYNTVIRGCNYGIYEAGGTTNVYNSAVFDNTDDFYAVEGTIDYCASDDGDGTNDVTESGGGAGWPNDFEGAATGDFRLKSGSNLRGAADHDASGVFTDDIAGTVRSAWDIGAWEYVAAGGASIVPLAMQYYRRLRA